MKYLSIPISFIFLFSFMFVIPSNTPLVVAEDMNLSDAGSNNTTVEPTVNVSLFNNTGNWSLDGLTDSLQTVCLSVIGVILILFLLPIIALIFWIVKTYREGKYYKCQVKGDCGVNKKKK